MRKFGLYMAKATVTLLTVAFVSSCAVSREAKERAAVRQQLVRQHVAEALSGRAYTVAVSYIHPRQLPTRHLDYGYQVRVSGDSIYSYLPYVGRAHSVPYGGGKALDFDDVIDEYSSENLGKGVTEVNMLVKSEEDTYRYCLWIYENGKADLTVYAREREAVSFSGELEIEAE